MEYGLIGEKLTHSFSREIHAMIGDYRYTLCEIEKEKLADFFREKDFLGLNVTVPYKTEVMRFLDGLSTEAEQIGAVNTVKNDGGKLTGYNTDAVGLKELILRNGIKIKDKNVLILGSGGTSKTAFYVAKDMGAQKISVVSRSKKAGCVTYENADNRAQVIINTTPCGMMGGPQNLPLCLSRFNNLEAVVDVVYSPLKTPLILDAESRGIKTANGLYMLVAQGIAAANIFGVKSSTTADKIYEKIKNEKQNTVLIGMPGCGKTAVGEALAEISKRPFFDTDRMIFEKTGRTPEEIIRNDGEAFFRKTESEIIKELHFKTGCIIATGGGTPTVKENVRALGANGVFVYIKRALAELSRENRPLSKDTEKLYEERKSFYEDAADITVFNGVSAEDTAIKIKKELSL